MFVLCQFLIAILVIFGKYCFNLCICVPLPEKVVKPVPLRSISQMVNKLQALERHFTLNRFHSQAKDTTDASAAHKYPTLVTKSSALTFQYCRAQTSPRLHPPQTHLSHLLDLSPSLGLLPPHKLLQGLWWKHQCFLKGSITALSASSDPFFSTTQ